MSRVWRGAVVLALAAGLGAVLSVSSAEKEKEKEPSIKAVMKHVFNPQNKQSLLLTIGKDLEADETDWAKVQKESKAVVRLVTPLQKATPPRGEQESWEKQTTATLARARSLEEAAEGKDKEKTLTTLKSLQMSCRACHTAHRILKKG